MIVSEQKQKRERQTQWQLIQFGHSFVFSPSTYDPPAEVVLGALDGAMELLAPLFVPVPPELPPLCSEAPLSLPQLSVYQVSMAVLSEGLVHVEAHMVVSAPFEAVQTCWQKQDQAVREVLEPPLHCCWACVRMVQDCPQAGRLPLPCVRS